MIALDFHNVLPEMLLALYAMAALLACVYAGKDALTGVVTWATAGVFIALAAYIGFAGEGSVAGFGGIMMILLLGLSPMRPRASVYFWATK